MFNRKSHPIDIIKTKLKNVHGITQCEFEWLLLGGDETDAEALSIAPKLAPYNYDLMGDNETFWATIGYTSEQVFNIVNHYETMWY